MPSRHLDPRCGFTLLELLVVMGIFSVLMALLFSAVQQARAVAASCGPGPGASSYSPDRSGSPCNIFHFWNYHPGGANFVLGDGSVHFLPYSANSIVPALASRAGGETVSLPD